MTRPLVLQSRDIDLLRGLFESRVMSGAQIATIYFQDHFEMAKKRLQLLAASGFVARHPDPLNRPAPFILAAAGLIELRSRGIPCEYPPFGSTLARRADVSARTLAHELEVMEVKAAFVRAARIAGVHIPEFTTWPLLHQFQSPDGQFVKPDGFVRLAADKAQEQSFFVELDRSTETQGLLVDRARRYLAFHRSGGFALRNGAGRDEFQSHPFRVLYILQTPERRNNTIERLLQQTSPILGLVWLTTFAEVMTDPLGPIWITPADYRDSLARSGVSISRQSPQWGYRRNTRRDRIVEASVPKRRLLGEK